jgi:RND family efflux transporter MFP subunit
LKKLSLLLLVLVFSIPLGCQTKQEKNKKATAEKAVPVKIATIQRKEIRITVSSVGTVKPAQVVAVKSKIPGRIVRIHVDEGSKVKKGDLLAELDPTDYQLAVRNAEAALKATTFILKEAEITLKDTKKDWERYERLYKKKVISKQKWDHLDAGYRKARIMRDLAQARVSRAKIALDIALTKLKDTKIHAPFQGIITKRLVDPGNRIYTMPPTVLMILMDISRVKIVSDIPEGEMTRLHASAPVSLKLDAFPHKTFKKKVTRIFPDVDPVTRTFTVEIILNNPLGKIKSGMFAHMKIQVKKIVALVIPRSALLKIPGTGIYYTFRVRNDDTVEKVNLETGIIQDNLVQVLKGLKEGNRVVVVGNTQLRTGKKITITKEENPT